MSLPFPGTKGKIVEAALTLFSRHGYNAVSVRDIARDVGIKDASIYSHFSSKAALLDEIVVHFRREFLASIPPIGDLEDILKVCSPELFFARGWQLFRKRMEDPLLVKTYLVLMRERHDDNQAAEAWRTHEEMVIGYVAEALRLLAAQGQIIDHDPEELAASYEYPILHLVGDYVARLNRGEGTQDIEEKVHRHRELFLSLIRRHP